MKEENMLLFSLEVSAAKNNKGSSPAISVTNIHTPSYSTLGFYLEQGSKIHK